MNIDEIKILQQSPLIGTAIKSILDNIEGTTSTIIKGNDAILRTSRGKAMVELSEDDLPDFEHHQMNQAFADLLVPLREEVSNPIVFWLAKNNPPGSKYHLVNSPITHHVLQIGESYTLKDILTSLCKALNYEGIKIERPWFKEWVKKSGGLEIDEIDPCKSVFSG